MNLTIIKDFVSFQLERLSRNKSLNQKFFSHYRAVDVIKNKNNIWEAAKAFNNQYEIKSWIVHYDVSMLPLSSLLIF